MKRATFTIISLVLITLLVFSGPLSVFAEEAGQVEETVCTEHVPVEDPAVPATCTASGLTAGSHCSVCGEVLTEQQEIPALGHTPETVTEPATLKKNGSRKQICTACGEVLQEEVIPKIASVTVKSSLVFKGSACRPSVTGLDSEGNQIASSFYTVTYTNNTAIGKAGALVRFKGDYSGEKSLSFTILPGALSKINVKSTTNTVTLSWSAVKGAQKYQIQKYDSAKKAWVTVKKTAERTYTAKNLKALSASKFRIRAYSVIDGKTYKGSFQKVTALTAPDQVTLRTVTSQQGTDARLSWKKVKGSGYIIYRKTGSNGSYQKIKTIKKASTLSYHDTNLSKDKQYYYKVRAYYAKTGAVTAKGTCSKGRKLVTMAALKNKISGMISNYSGKWAVYVKDLNTGSTMKIRPNTRFYAASIIKLYTMAATYQQIDRGIMQESAYIKNELYQMITVSSNEGFNHLTCRLSGSVNYPKGLQILNKYLQDNGYTRTAAYHSLPGDGHSLPYRDKSNKITARDCALLLDRIYKGKCVSKSASKKMLNTMLKQTWRKKIPAGIPSGIPIANKTGDYERTQHDVAIVFGEDTDYIICVLTTSGWYGIPNIARVSSAVYQYLN